MVIALCKYTYQKNFLNVVIQNIIYEFTYTTRLVLQVFETGSKLIKIAPYPNSSAIYLLSDNYYRGQQTIEFSMPYLQTNRSFIFYTRQSIVLSSRSASRGINYLKNKHLIYLPVGTLSQTETSLFLKVTPISSARILIPYHAVAGRVEFFYKRVGKKCPGGRRTTPEIIRGREKSKTERFRTRGRIKVPK